MPRRHRFIFFIILVILFFITAPLLIGYTMGYRYNFKKNKIEKTGMLIAESIPKRSFVYLNGKKIGATPLRIKNLLPGEYRATVSREGFYSYSKAVEIKSKFTSFINAFLLKNALPVNIFQGGVKNFILSPDAKKIALELRQNKKYELRLLNFESKETIQLLEQALDAYTNFEISWAADSSKLLIAKFGKKPEFFIYNLSDKKIIPVYEITRLNFDDLAFSDRDANLIYGRRQNTLFRLNLLLNKTLPIFSIPADFSAKGGSVSGGEIKKIYPTADSLFYLLAGGKDYYLAKSDTQQSKSLALLTKLPGLSLKFVSTSDTFSAWTVGKEKKLFLINNRDPRQISELANGVNGALWFKQKNEPRLLYFTDLELWIYNPKTEEKEMVTRLSKEIKKALIFKDAAYIIFVSENNLRAIEIDSQGGRNSFNLVSFNKIDEIQSDGQGKKIYFNGKIGNQEGLFELEL